MPNQRRIYILIGLIITIIVGGGILWSSKKPGIPFLSLLEEERPERTEGLIEKQVSEVTALSDIPELYPELSWTMVPVSEYFSGIPTIYYDNFGIEKDKTKWKEGYSSLDGQEWVAEQNIPGEEPDWTLLDDFQEYYSSELSKRGWAWSIRTNGFNIAAMSADGPTGSLWGYMKVHEGKVRAILLSWEAKDFSEPPAGVPGWSCPCKIEYRVFISDITSLDEILPQ